MFEGTFSLITAHMVIHCTLLLLCKNQILCQFISGALVRVGLSALVGIYQASINLKRNVCFGVGMLGVGCKAGTKVS